MKFARLRHASRLLLTIRKIRKQNRSQKQPESHPNRSISVRKPNLLFPTEGRRPFSLDESLMNVPALQINWRLVNHGNPEQRWCPNETPLHSQRPVEPILGPPSFMPIPCSHPTDPIRQVSPSPRLEIAWSHASAASKSKLRRRIILLSTHASARGTRSGRRRGGS